MQSFNSELAVHVILTSRRVSHVPRVFFWTVATTTLIDVIFTRHLINCLLEIHLSLSFWSFIFSLLLLHSETIKISAALMQ